jgi:ankyrin repeat protein
MRALLLAVLLSIASQVGAECGNLCDEEWWKTATGADLQAELDSGADVMAIDKYGSTPIIDAAHWGSAADIQALLTGGADVIAQDEFGDTPLHKAASSDYGEFENIQALGVPSRMIT